MRKRLMVCISIALLVAVGIVVLLISGVFSLSGEQIAQNFDNCEDNARNIRSLGYKFDGKAIYYTDIEKTGIPSEYKVQAPHKGYILYGEGFQMYDLVYGYETYGIFFLMKIKNLCILMKESRKTQIQE